MGVTTIRRKGNGATGGWFLASGRKHLRFSRSGSQRVPRSNREQLTADLVEIGQGKHGLRPRQVLGQASIPDLGEAPQLLDHSESMLATGSSPRARPVDHPPALAQGPLR